MRLMNAYSNNVTFYSTEHVSAFLSQMRQRVLWFALKNRGGTLRFLYILPTYPRYSRAECVCVWLSLFENFRASGSDTWSQEDFSTTPCMWVGYAREKKSALSSFPCGRELKMVLLFWIAIWYAVCIVDSPLIIIMSSTTRALSLLSNILFVMQVLIVHGGLFSKDGVKLDDIRKIDRNRQPPDSGMCSGIGNCEGKNNFRVTFICHF